MKDLRVAAVICQSEIGQVRRNVDDMTRWVRLAKREGSQLICFPELNITGYCTQTDKLVPSFDLNDSIVMEIVQLAVSEKIIILAGLIESGPDDRLYISHLVIGPDRSVGVYRKLHLAPPELKLFAPGNDIEVFTFQGVTFGVQLCYDAHFPELSARMVELGAEILFFPHASPRGNAVEKHTSWMRHLPARAFDNSVFVVACNQVGTNCNNMQFPGNALIIGPSGNLLKRAVMGQEGLLLADLSENALKNVRNHPMRHFFPNRRPELYCRSLPS